VIILAQEQRQTIGVVVNGNTMIKLTNILKEEVGGDFETFAGKRLDGATKITNDAKEKGGPALLTYHHFKVKLPYYKKAKDGQMDIETAKMEFKKLMGQLCAVPDAESMEQIEFQELVGKIEVLGELLIKAK